MKCSSVHPILFLQNGFFTGMEERKKEKKIIYFFLSFENKALGAQNNRT